MKLKIAMAKNTRLILAASGDANFHESFSAQKSH